ncbi:MAG: TusE/DsrC/DsvC family sulfur relay protein [Myxococcota bacterium]
MVTTSNNVSELAALRQEIAELRAEMRSVLEHQRARDELMEELTPILKEVLQVGTEKLAVLEQRGYFAFGRAGLDVVDRVVTGFTPEDVTALGENVVRILQTVRGMTQPAVLAIADEATRAVEDAQGGEPMSWRGLLHASRDEDVQRGLATMVAVLRRVGQAAHRGAGSRKEGSERLRQMLAPSRRKDAVTTTPPPPRPAPLAARPLNEHLAPSRKPADFCEARPVKGDRPAKGPVISLPGVTLDAEGFLADANAWNQDVAVQMARALNMPALTETHWKVIEFARKEFAETGKSPNVRRLSVGSGVGVKELYALFPDAPGKTAARVAGIPKPGGCL